jgi:flavocytochrome c
MVAAAGTSFQKKGRIHDSAELMYKDMVTAGLGLNHPDLARTVAEKSSTIIQWTIDYLGVKYRDKVHHLGGHSIPRSHATHNYSGSTIIRPLIKKIKKLGMEVRGQMCFKKILRHKEGRVCGVMVQDGYNFPDPESGILRYLKAKKAVILATGGFANDMSFRMTQDPRLTEDVDSTNKVSTTAEALIEALRIGATPVHLSWIQLGPWTSPDEKGYGVGPYFSDYVVFPFGIMVNPTTGWRFVNELADRKTRADAILKIGRPCIGIADHRGVEHSGHKIDHCLKKGVVKKFDQLTELSSGYGIPFDPLKETIEKYNRSVRENFDEEFRKSILPDAQPLTVPPYYGIRIWPKVHHTMGGIQINTRAQVMDLNQKPIKGLYAAGEVTGGTHGACRLGSCAITDCLVFGRIAGRNAASERI